MANEPLHELPLNGKQLVFLFMSATVVAVVIFLAGVMVGRGVRTPQDALAEPAALVDPTAPVETSSSPTSDSSAPVATGEELTYAGRLENNAPAEETLAPPREPVSPPVATAAREPEVAKAAPPAVVAREVSVPAAPPEPAGSGFVVQVAATTARSEADTIALRLKGKGYPAFVTSPSSGPRMFRVRVGKYKERREAETVATRLQREEQFKPWVTR